MDTLPQHAPLRYRTPRRIWLLIVLITVLLGSGFYWATDAYSQWMHKDLDHDASVELAANASSLTLALERRMLLSDGLKAFIDTSLMSGNTLSHKQFDTFAANFVHPIQGIRNLSVYPGGIAEYVYPLKNNESIIGLNLLTHENSAIRQNAERTKQTDQKTILGPFELTQGGLGILTRQSIFIKNEFWGFVSVVLDVPPILAEAGLTKENKGIEIAVRANGKAINGDATLFERSPQLATVRLSEGTWQLAAVPTTAKAKFIDTKIRIIRLLCSLGCALLIYIIYLQLTQKHKLQAMVKERTSNLMTANTQLAATFDKLSAAEDELRKQYLLLEGSERNLRKVAFHDTVTGLHNRMFFQDYLDATVISHTTREERFALFFIDLDQFKLINDTLGHSYGDMLLQEVGQRLKQPLIEGEALSRIGGDEFTIILPMLTDLTQVHQLAQQLVNLFYEPFLLQQLEYFVTASIGITIFPDHSQDADTLMKYADAAMYQAKEEGKNTYRIYDETLNADLQQKMYIKNSLRRALEHQEFEVFYQPQIELSTGRISGLEALLRWTHPKIGPISPTVFIPIAEESGLMIPIGEWVLRTACAQNKAWQDAGLPPVTIAVNLSARQFAPRYDLAAQVKAVLAETGLDPAYLELEITENMAMHDNNAAVLQELRSDNVRVSIDDFGTHYSSLSYLKRLPVDKIKIDRSFVVGIGKEPKDEAIILAMLLLAKHMELMIIAEGVETSEQLAFLQKGECHEIQGYFYYPPKSAETAQHILRSHTKGLTI
ncbi:EAL domain-containing protein [Paenibacillus sp. OV219]|uniref:bifunctional diguanylate cyclase/phosphodiesterase n=1 Tax=Paenibacillus sp. OV219 TaxID=1884377 RepID=UPI0008CB1027|nr:EAL domain-containing protein [Paenibacillus sp. OV219]SEN56375.1 diguanylate cyclase (GGDEF) domain-containing protein [Paenibacillus sp. OV219]